MHLKSLGNDCRNRLLVEEIRAFDQKVQSVNTRSRDRQAKARKQFFSEEKNQKTFTFSAVSTYPAKPRICPRTQT